LNDLPQKSQKDFKCRTCNHLVDNRYCMRWRDIVPDGTQKDGCDEWEDDVPF
jgi:hypothetical protein